MFNNAICSEQFFLLAGIKLFYNTSEMKLNSKSV